MPLLTGCRAATFMGVSPPWRIGLAHIEHLQVVLAAQTSLVHEFSAHNSLDDARFVNLFKLTRTSQIKKVK